MSILPQQDLRNYSNEEFKEVKYRRRLFIKSDIWLVEVANSLGYVWENGTQKVVGKIVEEYTSPTPNFKVSEVKISNGVSHIGSDGIGSYRIGLRILIDRYLYRDLIFFSGNKVRYYDELGRIFEGVISDISDVKMVEAGRRYDVRLTLLCIRKSTESEFNFEFTDVYDVGLKIEFLPIYIDKTEYVTFSFDDLYQTYEFVYDTKINANNSYFAYTTYQQMKNFGLDTYFTIRLDYEGGIIYLAPKEEVYFTSITVNTSNSILKSAILVSTDKVYIWAKDDIDECVRIGLFNYIDSNGNFVYTFSPKRVAKRSEVVAVFNRLLNYFEKAIV